MVNKLQQLLQLPALQIILAECQVILVEFCPFAPHVEIHELPAVPTNPVHKWLDAEL